ncbi:hypothetical protein COCNU_scaffold005847G000010 [Cocos nucifera]|nr:hypothetical protein [Cocos nucifera]
MGVGEPRTQWASRGSPYHPGDASGQLPPWGFRHCKWGRWGVKRMARMVGNTSRGTRPQRMGGPEGGEHAARAPDRRPRSGTCGGGRDAHPLGRHDGVGAARPQEARGRAWVAAAGRGDPHHPGGASQQVPPRGLRRTERHCKRAGDGTSVPWAPRTGIAQGGHESRAALPLRTEVRSAGGEDGARKRQARTPRWEGRGAERRQRARGRARAVRQRRALPPLRGIRASPTPARGLRSGDTSPGPPCHCARAGGPWAGKTGHARAGRWHGSAKHGRRGGKEGEQNVGSTPEGGPGPCVRGAPYHPDGASGQAPPRGFRRIERHCKWAGDGIRIPWAWRSGLAWRGPESLAAPPLHMPGCGRPAHAWSDRGQGSSAQGRRIAEARRRTSAGRPREELGRATEATPTTPMGHPGKSHPGGSKGASGIANGWVPGCASRGHGDRDL